MSRRLLLEKACAVCAIRFRVRRKGQLTCSHTCRAIRQSRITPQHFTMQAANQARQAQLRKQLEQELEGVTKIEAYERGRWRGYHSAMQRERREQRRSV